MPQTTKISPQEAASTAAKYLKDLVPIQGTPVIEEVEFVESANEWHITLGYQPADSSNHFAYALGKRDYKIFRVNADTGDVLSMKIRNISQ
jgi:hypothetical protein